MPSATLPAIGTAIMAIDCGVRPRAMIALALLLALARTAAAGDILCVGDAWCYAKELKCKPKEDCVLTCQGPHACRRATVLGPTGYKLTVDCLGKQRDDPCKRLQINATNSSAVAFNCEAVGLLAGGAQRQAAPIQAPLTWRPSSRSIESGWLAMPALCRAA